MRGGREREREREGKEMLFRFVLGQVSEMLCACQKQHEETRNKIIERKRQREKDRDRERGRVQTKCFKIVRFVCLAYKFVFEIPTGVLYEVNWAEAFYVNFYRCFS